jgi:hypothetical protein
MDYHSGKTTFFIPTGCLQRSKGLYLRWASMENIFYHRSGKMVTLFTKYSLFLFFIVLGSRAFGQILAEDSTTNEPFFN